MLPFPPASMAMNVRLLLCILGLFALSLAPARAQIAPVASPSGPVPAGPYVVVDVATGEALQRVRARQTEARTAQDCHARTRRRPQADTAGQS